MKESEIIKNYSDTLFGIVYKVRLIDTKFTDYRIVEKPEKYEAFITSLENTSKITLAELLNVL
jgi:predicted aspartyl protease